MGWFAKLYRIFTTSVPDVGKPLSGPADIPAEIAAHMSGPQGASKNSPPPVPDGKRLVYHGTGRPSWHEGTMVHDNLLEVSEIHSTVVGRAVHDAIWEAVAYNNLVGASQYIGNWATRDSVESAADVRGKLAITSEWKGFNGEAMYALQFTALPGVGVRQGMTGPMWDEILNQRMPGKGQQSQYMRNTPRERPDLYAVHPLDIRRLT